MPVVVKVDEIVKRDARSCVCGRAPEWGKLRKGGIVLACMNTKCSMFPAAKGPSPDAAIANWNGVVGDGNLRKRN